MRIAYASDLHMDFGAIALDDPFFDVDADVLVLAGDLCEYDHYPRHHAFFKKVSECFPQTLIVMGNHEHYGSTFEKTNGKISEFLREFDNIALLDRTEFEFRGVRFLGATLWGGMNRGDPMTLFAINNAMNDHRQIKTNRNGGYRKFRAEDALAEHIKDCRWLTGRLYEEVPTVVITHHAPSFRSIDPRYHTAHDRQINHAYFSDCDYLFENCEHVKMWIHGHVHIKQSYEQVRANPRGYPGEGLEFKLEVETISI